MEKTKLKKGDRVCTTGYGRTKTWGKQCGKIVRVFKGGKSVGVKWKGHWIEDEMSIKEIKRVND